MDAAAILQIVLIGITGWTLAEVVNLGKKVAALEARVKRLHERE